MHVMFENSLVEVSFARETTAPLPTLSIITLNGTLPIDEVTVESVCNATNAVLSNGSEFQTFWDLRKCPVPSVRIIVMALKWAWVNKQQLDRLNRKMAILLPSSRPIIFAIVDNVLRAFGPTCKIRCSGDAQLVRTFLDEAVGSADARKPPPEGTRAT